MKKLFLLTILLALSLASADQLLLLDYENSDNYTISTGYDDVLIKIETSVDATCRYSPNSDNWADMSPNFDLTNGQVHKKTFDKLSDGTHGYYIKCINSTNLEPKEFHLILNVDALVSAELDLSKDDPLPAGTIEIELETSKAVSGTPTLKYLINEEDPVEVSLEQTGEKEWRGYVLIDNTMGESIISFEFSAQDLEGRTGTEITSRRVFEVDTKAPVKITEFEATPDDLGIELSWHIPGDFDEINIYKSETQGVGYMSLFKSTDNNDYYLDKAVDEGKTYYYKISAVDEAGNEGPLSEEKASSMITDGTVTTSSTLSPTLLNQVNNFIAKITSLKSSLQSSKISTNSKPAQILSLEKTSTNLINELDTIQSAAEKYKDQDLSEDELSTKLNALDIKLKRIQKEFPVEITISEETEAKNEITESLIRETIQKYSPSLSEQKIEDSVEQTLDLIKEKELSITTQLELITLSYYDGTTAQFTILSRSMPSTLELKENNLFLEILPPELYGEIANLEFVSKNAEKIPDKDMISFDSSSKEIKYYIKGSFLQEFQDIKPTFIALETEEQTTSPITGNFILGLYESSGTFSILFIVSAVLLSYLLILKRQNVSESFLDTKDGIKGIIEEMKKNNLDSAKEHYKSVQQHYSKLEDHEKKKVYSKLDAAKNKILITEFEKDLSELNKTKDKKLIESLDKKFIHLPEKIQNKIKPLFEKIKQEVQAQ